MTVFHQGLAWVAQIALFLALGLLVFPSQLGDVAIEGTALALVLVFVARPLATFMRTAFDRFSMADIRRIHPAGRPYFAVRSRPNA